MTILHSMAARIGIGKTQSVSFMPMRGSAPESVWTLDKCEAQSLSLPATVTRFAIGETEVTDHVRFGGDTLTIRGKIASYPVTFAIGGGIANAIEAIQSGADSAFAGGAFPDRAPQMFAKLLELRETKREVLVTLSWYQAVEMVLADVSVDRDTESGDTLPLVMTFRKIRHAAAKLVAPIPDAQASALGAGGTPDAGRQSMHTSPTSPTPQGYGPIGGLGYGP